MRVMQILRQCAAWAACCGTVIPTALLSQYTMVSSASAEETQAPIRDVRLSSRGDLVGQVTNPQGQGIGGIAVQLWQGHLAIASSTTDEAGTFRFTGLQGGLYQVSGEQAQQVCRVWSADAAPPQAGEGILLVHDSTLVRGQGAYANPYGGGIPQATYSQGPMPGAQPGMAQSMPQGNYSGPVMDGSMPAGCDPNGMAPVYMGDPMMEGGMACPPVPPPRKFGWLANPWVLGGAVAVAIAIPLALSDDDDDSSS